jgi:DNA repair exonuclease SbcCD ATPase subunit
MVSALAWKRTELEQAQEKLEQHRRVTSRRDGLSNLSKFLRTNRDRFTEAVWARLLEHASQFVAEVTAGDVTALRRWADGTFTFVENGVEQSVDGAASGMQRAIFSTAVKLSLAAALGSRFGTLLFDEVTAAAADDTSLTFVSRLATEGAQTLLVTHRQTDAAAAEHLVQL